ncbi:hypothetical protein MVEN_00239500 [Mycena venus]|uniref:Uncharacterized protein n=1 Tax=Mycena venus TaxID=2733690 RepID=A0A8H6YXY5_9AGAR|nr:hypothetical protein MVEN_00239500 [Mycena venus]
MTDYTANAPTQSSSGNLLSEDIEQKVDTKLTIELPSSTCKMEDGESPRSSTAEIAVLKALLTQKTDASLKREVELRTKILELEKQNKRLKMKRAADVARIESLKAEVACLKDREVKQEEPQLANEEHAEESIPILDTDDEEPEDNETDVYPHLTAEADVPTSPFVTATTNLHPDSPARSSSQRPSKDAWPPVPGSTGKPLPGRDDSNTDIQVKDEVIDVVIKTEGEPDQFKRVTLIKSEDGKFDIWNVDGFGLGPTIEVDERDKRGFTRKVISDVRPVFAMANAYVLIFFEAFGGGHVECYHNWNPKFEQAAKQP